MLSLGFAPSFLARTAEAAGTRTRLLVAIFQRGAVDGLNMIVPYGDAAYYRLRPSIAIPRPGGTDPSAIDLNGFFGKVSAQIIAEGQTDPAVLEEYRKRYVRMRRDLTIPVIERGYATGEFKRRVDPHLLIDMIYGPIYYRLLVRYLPMNQQFIDELLDHVIAYIKSD